jgi:tetratricopeptide (TPR) repeat protein
VDVANTHNNMGICHGKLGHVRHAMYHLEQALDIRLDVHGGEVHAEIATTLHNIGNVLQQARDYVGAIQCFGDAKRILEQVYGTHDHVQVGRACNAMGHVYYEAHQYEDALDAMTDAMTIFERVGWSHQKNNVEVEQTRRDIQELTERLIATRTTTTNWMFNNQRR